MNIYHNIACGLIIITIILTVIIILFWNKLLKRYLSAVRLHHLKKILPFNRILDDCTTIMCEGKTLVKVIKLDGIDFNTKSNDEIEHYYKKRISFFNELSQYNIFSRLMVVRNKRKKRYQSQLPNVVAQEINDKWTAQFKMSYHNDYYLILSYKPKAKQSLQKAKEITNALVQMTKEYLNEHNPRELSHVNVQSPLICFWYRVINGVNPPKNIVFKNNFSNITTKTIQFDTNKGVITASNGVDKIYSSIIVVKEWSDTITSEFIYQILTSESKFVLLKQIQSLNAIEAISKLKYMARQDKFFSLSKKENNEFDIIIDKIANKKDAFHHCQFLLIVESKNENNLHKKINRIKQKFLSHGIIPLVENIAIEWLWRSQIPENDFIVYKNNLLSSNLATLISLPEEKCGFENNDWGKGALQYYYTLGKNIYSFQLHETCEKESLAHSVVIAPSGSGKTTFFEHLIVGALKYPISVFIFDRLLGTKIFTKSINGEYISISNDIYFNPFVDNNVESKTFGYHFLQMLIENNASCEELSRAIDLIYTLPKEERILSEIIDYIFPSNTQTKALIQPWINKDIYGSWFNGYIEKDGYKQAHDVLDLENNYLMAFDMTAIQQYPKLASVVTYYLMYRIRSMIRKLSKGHLIFIDETKPMLQDKFFKDQIEILLLEHRKLRGSINLCFQEPNAIGKSGMQEIILQQCPTKLLFPNINAKKSEYDIFNLTELEWQFVKGRLPFQQQLKHSLLVKRNQYSVILNTDLSSLNEMIMLYRSGSDAVMLVDELERKYGVNKWVKHYLRG